MGTCFPVCNESSKCLLRKLPQVVEQKISTFKWVPSGARLVAEGYEIR